MKETIAEWAVIHTDDEGNILFSTYKKFRKSFLEQFTDFNLTETAIEKLLTIKKKRMKIQKFATKIINLVYRVKLEGQIIKTLIFRGLYPKDQN